MRKLLVAVLALGLVAAVRTTSFAFTSSIAISTLTASATFTGAGSVNMSYQFMNLAGGTTNQVWWNTGNINLGSTSWWRADSYLVLTTTMTAMGGAVRLYTNNVLVNNPTASPYYGYGIQTSSNSPNDPAGLICVSTNTRTLPMCWRVSSSTITPSIAQGGSQAGTNALTVGTLWDTNTTPANQAPLYPCYLWMMDKGTFNFWTTGASAAPDYSIIRDSMRGIQHAEAGWGAAPSPVYVYFGANFATAVTSTSGVTYKTSALELEAFFE